MATRTTADIHFDEADVHHRWHPDSQYGAYGVLKFGSGANVYFQTPGQLDAVIIELAALKQEMAPPVLDVKAPAPEGGWCPAETVLDDGDETRLYCDRDAGHPGSHHAPGPDEGSEVAWSDEMAQVTA